MFERWIQIARLDVRSQSYADMKATYDRLVARYGRVKARIRGDHEIVLSVRLALRGRGRMAA